MTTFGSLMTTAFKVETFELQLSCIFKAVTVNFIILAEKYDQDALFWYIQFFLIAVFSESLSYTLSASHLLDLHSDNFIYILFSPSFTLFIKETNHFFTLMSSQKSPF